MRVYSVQYMYMYVEFEYTCTCTKAVYMKSCIHVRYVYMHVLVHVHVNYHYMLPTIIMPILKTSIKFPIFKAINMYPVHVHCKCTGSFHINSTHSFYR